MRSGISNAARELLFRVPAFKKVSLNLIEIAEPKMRSRRQLLHKGGMAAYDLVVIGKLGTVRNFIVRSRRNESNSCRRHSALKSIQQFAIAFLIDVKIFLVERHIVAIVHAQHDCDHRWLMRKHVPLQPRGHIAGIAAIHRVSRDSSIPERNMHLRIAGEDEVLHKAGIQPLGRDAVAIKDHSVAFMQCKFLAMTSRCAHRQ